MYENSGTIYMIYNKINNKKYIGQCINFSSNGKKYGYIKRWNTHLKNSLNNKNQCRLLENAIKKYGKDNFYIFEMLICGIDELNYFENEYILEYNTLIPFGYNLMTGGCNGRLHSIQTRKLMSITRTGKKHKDITKYRIKMSNVGRKLNDINKYNISKSSKYRNMSYENYKKLKESLNELELIDLPMYVSYFRRNNRNVDAISIRIPNKKQKTFSSKKISLTEKIKLAINYLNGYRSEESPQFQ